MTAAHVYRAELHAESMCGAVEYVIVEWSRDGRQAERRAFQRAAERRLVQRSIVVAEREHWPCDDCGRVTRADCLRTDVGNHPVCLECAAKAVRAQEPPSCRRCGVDIGEVAAEEHGGLCEHCETEAHEQDQYDFERVHAAGSGAL